ncbi:HNH endonuclease signature motif containing protein [Arthrobacter sp. TB 26]|uniref:HNH endonuclease signature motif containing protein n=1 Tax=Arthrobacter sp. TB 26 TaxID=494420 RepID=UPI0003FF458E|nr:HNH endonuclease signature motif containing protein [Arthrobacter sp. TB 26]
MKASEDFIPLQATRPGAGILLGIPRLPPVPHAADDVDCALDGALALLRSSHGTALRDAALFGVTEASDFAGGVEELSRIVDYLQLVAAAAVDRTRNQAAAARNAAAKFGTGASAGWLTGWNTDAAATTPVTATRTATMTAPATAGAGPDALWDVQGGADSAQGWVDDGYRNTTEFLRARLRITAAEARRRLALASDVLPRSGLSGQPLPAVREELAAVLAAGDIASRAATLISLSLGRVRHVAAPGDVVRMEHALTRTAVENDQDFLTRIAKRWTDALDQDGAEPSEQELRQRQGAFIRRSHRGLQHLEIFATADQFEHLLTVMNTATNPRTGFASDPTADTAESAGPGARPDADTSPSADASGAVDDPAAEEAAAAARLDQRTRPQRLLDGLVGACKVALAAGELPASGGLRPQVMVTIDYRDLLEQLGGANPQTRGPGSGAGSLMFTGPVTASTARKIACDADIIPIVLGGNGRILDIGRASRVFPPHIRKALTARDRGCAFPQCTIPAPWCEAHHIDYWSRGGSTGTGNGALLCSHHHHVVHKEQWTIQLHSGIPWFIPPPHLDPRQVPRRNSYFRLE